jgi:acylphosphatase
MSRALQFEVHGKVQGVFFRKHTVEKARELGLVGWCANSARGSVVGEAVGSAEGVAALRAWFEAEGSPASRVERVEATETERPASAGQYATFERRPNVP